MPPKRKFRIAKGGSKSLRSRFRFRFGSSRFERSEHRSLASLARYAYAIFVPFSWSRRCDAQLDGCTSFVSAFTVGGQTGKKGNVAHIFTMNVNEDARRLRYLQWLLATPAIRKAEGWPDSQNKLADELGVTPRTLRNWRAEPSFRARWEKEAKDIVGEPDKVQKAIQRLYDLGFDDEVSAATQVKSLTEWLKAVGALKPPAVDTAKKNAAELSDAELEAFIAEEAQRKLSERAV